MSTKQKPKIPEPLLVGERVILRLPRVRDAAAMADYFRRNKSFHQPTEPIRPKEHYTDAHWKRLIPSIRKRFQKDVMVYLLLCLRDNPSRVSGVVNFSQIYRGPLQACYLGYAIDKKEEGKGLMTEAVRLAVGYMFEERKLHRIMANYMPRNARSARVLKKVGFRIDGRAKAYLLINGKWEDHILTSLVNSKWRAGKI